MHLRDRTPFGVGCYTDQHKRLRHLRRGQSTGLRVTPPADGSSCPPRQVHVTRKCPQPQERRAIHRAGHGAAGPAIAQPVRPEGLLSSTRRPPTPPQVTPPPPKACPRPGKVSSFPSERILPRLRPAVRHRIHDLEGFGGPKRQCCLKHEQTTEHAHSTGDRRSRQADAGRGPRHVQGPDGPHQDDSPVEQPAETMERQDAGGYLKSGGPRPQEEPIEVAALNIDRPNPNPSCRSCR